MNIPILPPKKIPLFLRPLVALSEKITGKVLLPSRLLTWSPGVALASAFLELGVEGAAKKLGGRVALLVRIRVSHAAACPFCISLNSRNWEKGITAEEMAALEGRCPVSGVTTFSEKEMLALEMAQAATETPLKIPGSLTTKVQEAFGSRNTVRLAALIAKVNYWARFSQTLGVPAS